MSYEKYIKYKTKYLNLKAEIHNRRIQSGGANNNFVDNDFIQTLGSTPNSEIYNNKNNFNLVGGGDEKSETDVNLPDKLSSSESSKSSDSDLPSKLSETPVSESESVKSVKTTESSEKNIDKKLGGARKLKKKRNVFSESDSELDVSESSLLSFSSIESDSSSD